ncbi:MAG: nucleotidyl transferase AbiEii/AbiGii toxin family protein [Planctomycetota bacterium]
MPLWDVGARDSLAIGPRIARQVVLLDPHELVAGKLAALFGRHASRDLFDVHSLLQLPGLERRKLRLAFVVHGASSRRDWRTLVVGDIDMEPRDAERELVPLLRADLAPARHELEAWCARLVAECHGMLSALLPLEGGEAEFLERIHERGEIAPELLTDDARLQQRIRSHPGLLWKTLNVRRHRGLDNRPGSTTSGGEQGS